MKKVKQHILPALLLFLFCSASGQKFAVYFPSDGATLDAKNRAKLDTFFKIGSVLKVSLKAYCDSIGTSDYNVKLSKRRVNAVRKYLLTKHLADSIIHEEALGEISAKSSNETEDLRAKNRRVDVVIQRKRGPTIVVVKMPVNVAIKGQVLSEDSVPMKAEVSVADKSGKEIQKATSGQDGKYTINATLLSGDEYFVTYFNDSSFVGTNTVTVGYTDATLNIRHIKLRKLKEGQEYTFENLHFFGGETELLPSSKPALNALSKLMKRNKGLVIRIEGHINDPFSLDGSGKRRYPSPPHGDQWLSDERAKAVYKALMYRGIEAERMSTKGYGSQRMLFPYAKNEAEMSQNRRVEIFIVKMN